MADNISLNPCPFCGGDSVKVTTKAAYASSRNSHYKAYVRCLKCYARGPTVRQEMLEDAIYSAEYSWNWRLPEVERQL